MALPEPPPITPQAGKPSPFCTDPLNANDAGPALIYVSTQHRDGGHVVQRVDLNAPDDPRERAIARALLHHALALLDATEPTRRTPVGVEDRRR